VSAEKYGGAFLYGKYPANAGDRFKQELLDALEAMAADAVGIMPEGPEIATESVSGRGGVSGIHSGCIETVNKEMSKAVPGRALTTDIGSAGSCAAARARGPAREDLAASDRKRTAEDFNRPSEVRAFYNSGSEVAPPKSGFARDNKEYISRRIGVICGTNTRTAYEVGHYPKAVGRRGLAACPGLQPRPRREKPAHGTPSP
jgi:hypothetical protein